MKPFRFCPACGKGLGDPDHDGGAECDTCSRSWYRNSAPTVGCVIVSDGKALVTERGREPEKGRYDVPGGFLGPGEEPLDGLKREVREELGIEIEVTMEDFVQMATHRYGAEGDFVLAIGFRARIRNGAEPTPADDVAAVRWVTNDELDQVEFAWPHDRDLVRKALAHER